MWSNVSQLACQIQNITNLSSRSRGDWQTSQSCLNGRQIQLHIKDFWFASSPRQKLYYGVISSFWHRWSAKHQFMEFLPFSNIKLHWMLLHLAKTESMCDSYQDTNCQAIWTPPGSSVDNIPNESKIENVPIVYNSFMLHRKLLLVTFSIFREVCNLNNQKDLFTSWLKHRQCWFIPGKFENGLPRHRQKKTWQHFLCPPHASPGYYQCSKSKIEVALLIRQQF